MVKTRPSSSALVRPSNLSFCQLQDIWTSMNTRRKCQVPNPTPPPPLFHVKQNLEAMCTYTSFRVFNLNSITFSATFVDSLLKSGPPPSIFPIIEQNIILLFTQVVVSCRISQHTPVFLGPMNSQSEQTNLRNPHS